MQYGGVSASEAGELADSTITIPNDNSSATAMHKVKSHGFNFDLGVDLEFGIDFGFAFNFVLLFFTIISSFLYAYSTYTYYTYNYCY